MKPFGYIDLAAEGKVESYDPPDALVSNFRVFRRVKDDRLVATMEVIPDSHARASIDVLKRAEKPGARRSILKAVKADSTTVPIVRDTTVTVEITDTAAMHIPFFQYAKKDVYRDLEARGTPLATILKKTVDLNAIRPTAAESEVPRETQREFDLVSDHPGVLFTTRRARFGKFYVGPTEDEDHGVALHGSLQEPVTIDIRSGFNFRKVTLPIGYDMVMPLHGGTISFDETTGKPRRIVHNRAEFEPLVPPRDVPADVADGVPGAPGGPPLAEPPSPAGTGEPLPPSPPNVFGTLAAMIPGETSTPAPETSTPALETPPAVSSPVVPEVPTPGALTPDEEAERLANLSLTDTTAPSLPESVPPSPPVAPGAPAPTDTNNLPPSIPTYLPTAPETPAATPAEAVASTALEPLPPPPADVEVPSELEAPLSGQAPAEQETLPEGVPRYPPNLPFEPVSGAPPAAFIPTETPAPVVSETVPEEAPAASEAPAPETTVEPSPEETPAAPAEVRGPIDGTFRETLLSNLTSYIAGVLNLQDDEAPIRAALDAYAPLTSMVRRYSDEHPEGTFVLTMPGPTSAGNWSTLPSPSVDTNMIRIVSGENTFTFQLRAVDVSGPRPTVSRVIVARPASFRMPPNEVARPFVRYIPDGKDAVIVARDARFRMPPNESTFAYVKILA